MRRVVCSLLLACAAGTLAVPAIRQCGAMAAHSRLKKPSLSAERSGRSNVARCVAARMEVEEPEAELVAAAALPARAASPSGLSIISVLLAAFLNLLGYTMTIPLGAALKSHFELPMGASFGLLSSAYPLGTLGAYFLWPQLSDRVGRKPVISMSLLGSAAGLALQCLALRQGRSLAFFLGCKVLTGFCAGAGPVAKAYLADLGSTSGELPRYMAWRDAANTLAFIMGPLLGGRLFMATGSLAAVIGATAAGSFAAAALTAAFMAEVDAPPDDRPQRGDKSRETQPASSDGFVACPLGTQLVTAVASVCVITALYNCGSATFNAVFAPLAQDLAGLDAGKIGLAYTLLASLSFAISTTASASVQRRLGSVSSDRFPPPSTAFHRPPPPPITQVRHHVLRRPQLRRPRPLPHQRRRLLRRQLGRHAAAAAAPHLLGGGGHLPGGRAAAHARHPHDPHPRPSPTTLTLTLHPHPRWACRCTRPPSPRCSSSASPANDAAR